MERWRYQWDQYKIYTPLGAILPFLESLLSRTLVLLSEALSKESALKYDVYIAPHMKVSDTTITSKFFFTTHS